MFAIFTVMQWSLVVLYSPLANRNEKRRLQDIHAMEFGCVMLPPC